MNLHQEDKNRLSDFYGTALRIYGPESPKALRWLSSNNQVIRFGVLSKVGELSGSSILDVGCGVGDLYPFLSRKFQNFRYMGVDILPEMVREARQKYPEARFWCADIFDIEAQADYVLASGALTFTVGPGRDFYYGMIARMFTLARKAVAFNMLDAAAQKSDGEYLAYDKREVEEVCRELTANYKFIADYELGDFTVFLYK